MDGVADGGNEGDGTEGGCDGVNGEYGDGDG